MQLDVGSSLIGAVVVLIPAIVIYVRLSTKSFLDGGSRKKQHDESVAVLQKISQGIGSFVDAQAAMDTRQKDMLAALRGEPAWVGTITRRLDALHDDNLRLAADDGPSLDDLAKKADALMERHLAPLSLMYMTLSSIKVALNREPAWPGWARQNLHDIVDALRDPPCPSWTKIPLAEIVHAIVQIPERMTACTIPSEAETAKREEAISRHLAPVLAILSRIAADTELTRRKIDAFAIATGMDPREQYAQHMDNQPDEAASTALFQDMVMEEMKTQGLSWEQATHSVKARLAHRRTGR